MVQSTCCFEVSDVVETGHSKFTGGTLAISFTFDMIIPDSEIYLKIMDTLDHCLITDNESLSFFSDRYFLLTECKNIFEDVVGIMSYLIIESNLYQPMSIKISRRKESYSSPVVSNKSTIVSYSIEG